MNVVIQLVRVSPYNTRDACHIEVRLDGVLYEIYRTLNEVRNEFIMTTRLTPITVRRHILSDERLYKYLFDCYNHHYDGEVLRKHIVRLYKLFNIQEL